MAKLAKRGGLKILFPLTGIYWFKSSYRHWCMLQEGQKENEKMLSDEDKKRIVSLYYHKPEPHPDTYKTCSVCGVVNYRGVKYDTGPLLYSRKYLLQIVYQYLLTLEQAWTLAELEESQKCDDILTKIISGEWNDKSFCKSLFEDWNNKLGYECFRDDYKHFGVDCMKEWRWW